MHRRPVLLAEFSSEILLSALPERNGFGHQRPSFGRHLQSSATSPPLSTSFYQPFLLQRLDIASERRAIHTDCISQGRDRHGTFGRNGHEQQKLCRPKT